MPSGSDHDVRCSCDLAKTCEVGLGLWARANCEGASSEFVACGSDHGVRCPFVQWAWASGHTPIAKVHHLNVPGSREDLKRAGASVNL